MSTGNNTDLIKFQYDRDLRCLIIGNIIPLNTHAVKTVNSTDSSTQFLLTIASERYTIYFDIGRKPGHA